MARTLINGAEQILANSIPLSALVSGYSIPTTNLADGATFVKSSGTVAMTANLNLGNNLINNVGAGIAPTDAVNVGQLNALKAGMQLHFCQLVATTNITALTGLPTIDGVTLVAGSRVLLIGQTTGAQNGPWVVASGAWTRPTDWASAANINEGQYFIIDADGSTYKNTKFFCTNTGTLTVDTTATTFVQDLSGASYTASGVLNLAGTVFSVNLGNGVVNTGNAITVKNADSSISVTASGIAVSAGTSGQILMTNAGGTGTNMITMSGDATITSAGVVSVNHTSGTGFTKYTDMVSNEIVQGTFNGTNTAFTLNNVPATTYNGVTSLELFLNGNLLTTGAGNDYTVTGTAITMLFAPLSTDRLTAFYMK